MSIENGKIKIDLTNLLVDGDCMVKLIPWSYDPSNDQSIAWSELIRNCIGDEQLNMLDDYEISVINENGNSSWLFSCNYFKIPEEILKRVPIPTTIRISILKPHQFSNKVWIIYLIPKL